MTEVSLFLDWTPNCNHTGFFVAKSKGWYADSGLSVAIQSPHRDGYTATPLSQVTGHSPAFAITPSESVISYHTWPGGAKPKVQAVAACLQNSTSAIVTLADSGITRPAQLDGKTYASYGARFEGRIVQQMIRNDGGSGDFKESVPPMLGIWNTLLKGEADATWVFMGWEGVEAELKGVALNAFKLEDFNIKYGYSPLLVTHPDTIRDQPEVVSAFMAASARGFKYAAEHPEEAAKLLLEAVAQDTADCPLPQPLDEAMLVKAQVYTSQHYLNESGRWGVMDKAKWDAFLDWLSDSGLLTSKVQSRTPGEHTTTLDGLRQGDTGDKLDRSAVDSSTLFTNQFLP